MNKSKVTQYTIYYVTFSKETRLSIFTRFEDGTVKSFSTNQIAKYLYKLARLQDKGWTGYYRLCNQLDKAQDWKWVLTRPAPAPLLNLTIANVRDFGIDAAGLDANRFAGFVLNVANDKNVVAAIAEAIHEAGEHFDLPLWGEEDCQYCGEHGVIDDVCVRCGLNLAGKEGKYRSTGLKRQEAEEGRAFYILDKHLPDNIEEARELLSRDGFNAPDSNRYAKAWGDLCRDESWLKEESN